MMMVLENVFYVQNQQFGISQTKNVLDVLKVWILTRNQVNVHVLLKNLILILTTTAKPVKLNWTQRLLNVKFVFSVQLGIIRLKNVLRNAPIL